MWFTLALFVASFVLSQLLAPKPKFENARPAGLGDFSVPTATEARGVQLVFGTVRIRGPNVVWYGDLEQTPLTQSVKKNLFSKANITVGYKYYLGLQFGLCRGDASTGLLRIWIGEDEVWSGSIGFGSVQTATIDKPMLFGGDTLGAGGVTGTFRFHPGTAGQTVSTYLSDFQQSATGTLRTPRYTGTCYGVFEHGYVGNSTSLKAWSFEVQRITNGLNLDVAEKIINTYDANPMNVMYEVITNTEWGMGQPAAKIDLTSFEDAANTLAAEGCGFSMLVDTTIETEAFREEIERQINGKIFLDHQTRKWRVKLARDDYSIGSVPQLSKATNVLEVSDFTRGSWIDTKNQVRLFFHDRQNDYKERPAPAFDMANAMIQGGGTVLTMTNEPVEVRFGGVKHAALANQLAFQVLRTMSYPLAKAKIVVDRSLWDLRPNDVVAWSDDDLGGGFTQLPMRAINIDYGSIDDGRIVLDLVQDVWKFAAGSFGSPPATGWSPPVDTLLAFDQVFVFEAPRAFLTRAAGFNGTYSDRVVTAARQKSVEVGYEIFQRVGAAAYVTSGLVDTTVRVGTITSTLVIGDVSGVSFNVTCASAADKTAVLAAFNAGLGAVELGVNLYNVLRLDDELMIATTAASGSGNTIDFSGVYRQVADTVQATHTAEVWMLFMGVGITEQNYANAETVDVKLLPTSSTDQVAIGSVTAASVVMANRLRRPLPPGRISLNGTANDTTSVSLEGSGSGDGTGILLDLIRRDIRSTDEVQALTLDAASITTSFPSDVTYTFTVAVYDTSSTPTLLFTTTAQSAASIVIPRTRIFRFTGSVIPSSMRFDILTSHVYAGTTYTARHTLQWSFTTVSALTGLFNLGTINDGVSSNSYTADATGTWEISIATAMTTGNVQVNVAGAGFVNVITTGNLTGTFAANSSDSIVVKHNEGTAGYMTALLIRNPSSVAKAYGVAYKP